MSTRHAFDSLCLRDNRLFGWGWLLSERSPAARIELRLSHAGGGHSQIRCQLAGARADLADAYPSIAHAASGGFLVQARLRQDLRNCEAHLHVRYIDGEEELLPLPGFPEAFLTHAVVSQARGRWRSLLELARQGEWALLMARGRGYLRNRVQEMRRPRVVRTAPAAASVSTVLVFDHAMGGGANHFRRELVAGLRAEGRRVLLFTPDLATLSYDISESGPDGEWVARYPDLTSGLEALPAVGEVVVNSLVSFDDPLAVLGWIEASAADAVTTFYLHDYHPACPVWTLVDETGRYCGVPALERCAKCLSGNDAAFLALMPKLDVADWRERWGRFLARADHLVAFSQASVAVLGKAFPVLAADRILLRPHRTDYIRPRPVAYELGLPLTIGIVGHINAYKGATLVAEMAQLIERRQLPARIVVIGVVDNVQPSAALTITGSYQGDQLPDLLRDHRVGVCLLPSVWHETFSYVTSELMAHRMPLAVFELGAPAERVGRYDLGRIIPEISASAALDTLFQFRADLLARHRGAATGGHAGSE